MPVALSSSYFTLESLGPSTITGRMSGRSSPRSMSCQGFIGLLCKDEPILYLFFAVLSAVFELLQHFRKRSVTKGVVGGAQAPGPQAGDQLLEKKAARQDQIHPFFLHAWQPEEAWAVQARHLQV